LDSRSKAIPQSEQRKFTDDQITSLKSELAIELLQLFSYKEVNDGKVFHTLKKNDMDVKKALASVKKNIPFYRKIF